MPQTWGKKKLNCQFVCWPFFLSCTSSFCTDHLRETLFQRALCSSTRDLEQKWFPGVIRRAAPVLWYLLFSCFSGWGHCQALCPGAGPASASPGAASPKYMARAHRGIFSCFEWVSSLVPPSMQGCGPRSSLNKWISFWNWKVIAFWTPLKCASPYFLTFIAAVFGGRTPVVTGILTVLLSEGGVRCSLRKWQQQWERLMCRDRLAGRGEGGVVNWKQLNASSDLCAELCLIVP